jgi:hypothetical protein
MTDATIPIMAFRFAGRSIPLLVPACVALGLAVGALILTGGPREATDDVIPLDPAAFTDIEFMARARPLLEAAVAEGCAASGCDADLVSTLVRVEAVAMTPEELDEAIRVQTLAMTEIEEQIAAAGDDRLRRDLSAEAAARGTVLRFHKALRARARAGETIGSS